MPWCCSLPVRFWPSTMLKNSSHLTSETLEGDIVAAIQVVLSQWYTTDQDSMDDKPDLESGREEEEVD